MDSTATLVWIAPDPPDASQARALSNFALVRSVKLVEPSDERPPSPFVHADSIADDVETLIERARDAIAARDVDGADRALAAAESLLRAHAELPQAAWLMAEVERCRSLRWIRMPRADAGAADRAWTRSIALDGGRVRGIVENGSSSTPRAATIRLDLAPFPELEAWLDGRAIRMQTADTLEGLHTIVVTWAGAPAWATWIEVPPGTSTVMVEIPSPPPCSRADVERARIERASVLAPDVRCGRWIAATPAPGERPGAVRVATCETGACGALIDWIAPEPWTSPLPSPSAGAQEHDRGRWPTWTTWAAVGGGAAIVAGAAVILVEGLRPAPTETRFVNNGLKVE